MIILKGVIHGSQRSSREVFELIQRISPKAVGIELCQERLEALLRGPKEGFYSYFTHYFLSKIQELIIERLGGVVGEEFISALRASEEVGARVFPIDLPLYYLLGRLKEVPLREKVSLILELVPRRMELDRDGINQMLYRIRRRSPSIYSIIIEERDEFMARQLMRLEKEYDSVVGVVGIGHLPGISKILKERLRNAEEKDN